MGKFLQPQLLFCPSGARKKYNFGSSFALLKVKYVRPSQQENKNANNLKVTVLKQYSKSSLPDKVTILKMKQQQYDIKCKENSESRRML